MAKDKSNTRENSRTNDISWNSRIARFFSQRFSRLNSESDEANAAKNTSRSLSDRNTKDRFTNVSTAKRSLNFRQTCSHNMKKVVIIHDGYPSSPERHSRKERFPQSANGAPRRTLNIQSVPTIIEEEEEEECPDSVKSGITPTEKRVRRSGFLRNHSHGQIWDARVTSCQQCKDIPRQQSQLD
ncbi:uncharacterized protein [Antedon mediterranea]|uniref:uncharacterized protein n=1 Tax=Antedon mediterranea TaxID=105859 RepID=UPI003AF6D7CA